MTPAGSALCCTRHEGASRYVGNLGLTARQLFGGRAMNGCASWFADAEVYYTHTARTAIQRALVLLDFKAGDEILVPAYHCGSELDVLLKAGLRVRLYRTTAAAEIDLADLQQRITTATRAIYVIHYFGFPQPLTKLAELCRARGLRLIEDCALSAFTQVDGGRIGRAGDAAVYNFPKMLPVPDGGALVINNPSLSMSAWPVKSPPMRPIMGGFIRLLKQSFLRCQPDVTARTLFGLLARAPEVATGDRAAIGMPESYYFTEAMSDLGMSRLTKRALERIDLSNVRTRRRENFSRLLNRVSKIDGVKPLFSDLPSGVCPLCLPVLVPAARQVAGRLRALSVPAIAWWAGYHRAALNWNDFPESRHLKDHVVALPIHPQLDERAVEFIGGKLSECLSAA